MHIKEVKWGIANRFDDGTIEINHHLKCYPRLYNPILRHEIGHDDSVFSWNDLKHDLVPDNKLNQWELIKFMMHHPKSLTQLLPIYYSKERGFNLDINMSILWFLLIL